MSGQRKVTEKFAPVSAPGTAQIEPDDEPWADVKTTPTAKTDASLSLPGNAKDRDRPVLTVLGGLNAGQVFPLTRTETIIGRGTDAHVRLVDAGVSREHARILQSNGRFVVEDIRSTNGTYVAGERVERRELQPFDRVQIGPQVVLWFQIMSVEEEALSQKLYESSTRDHLTHVYNRKYLAERLATETAYAIRHKTSLGVIIFDLDHFKRVNDDYGHLAGDEVLRTVAARVARLIRSEDVIARYGGEEFVIIARGIEHANVVRFAERVRALVEGLKVPSPVAPGEELRVTISAGVASLSPDPKKEPRSVDGLLAAADARLYEAKRAGRNRVVA
jgi:diguanylate cyclase (GGDEF)-like protein